MRRCLYPALFLLVVAICFVGCSKNENPLQVGKQIGPPLLDPTSHVVYGEGWATVDLIAGATDIGTVTCSLEDNTLTVTYATEGGWHMAATQLAVAASLEGIPMTPTGRPKVGAFPFNETHIPAVTESGFEVDLDALGLGDALEVCVAAHADAQLWVDVDNVDLEPYEIDVGIIQEEGAWGEGALFPPPTTPGRGRPKMRAMYFTIDMNRLRGLVLWSKLGSADEVENSEVGPDGIIIGDIDYVPGKYDNGFTPLPRTGDHNIPDNYIEYHVNLGQKGCIEFWYQPNWVDWRVGHIVEIMMYGRRNDTAHFPMRVTYNDWQDLLAFALGDPPTSNWASVSIRPRLTPEWTTDEPFHIAFSWDGTQAEPSEKLKLYLNGTRVPVATAMTGNPTFDTWASDAYLAVASRTWSGDWDRHPWEGLEGVMDNIKIWDFPKDDFSDRFHE